MSPDEYTVKEEMLGVDAGHQLYLQRWGTQTDRAPFLYLHGGPGSGCSDSAKLLFDGKRDYVVFFDQRGAGRSAPAGSVKDNTTAHLIDDIETIRRHLGIEKFRLVGGSWGTCLAVQYAIAHPQRVTGMALRGIFTGTQAEIDHLYMGGFRGVYPEVWDRFVAATPARYRKNPGVYHLRTVLEEASDRATASALAMDMLDAAIARLETGDNPAQADPTKILQRVRILAHYAAHACFLPHAYILKHARELTMPIHMVHGRYDMLCLPRVAYVLHQALPNSLLQFTIAGHSGMDRENLAAMQRIIQDFTEVDS